METGHLAVNKIQMIMNPILPKGRQMRNWECSVHFEIFSLNWGHYSVPNSG